MRLMEIASNIEQRWRASDDSLYKQQRNQFEGILVLHVCLLFFILWGAIFYPNSLFLYCKFIWKLILAKLEWHILGK